MKLTDIIKGRDLLTDVVTSANVYIPHTGEMPEISILISPVSIKLPTDSAYRVGLTREAAIALRDQLTAALLIEPYTAEEIANHREHQVYRKEREHGYGNR
jgi:hypothetical protein